MRPTIHCVAALLAAILSVSFASSARAGSPTPATEADDAGSPPPPPAPGNMADAAPPPPAPPDAADAGSPAPTAAAAAFSPPSDTSAEKPHNDQSLGFLSRFLDGYTAQYAYTPKDSPPERRSMPDSLDSPPFPASHWSLNGTADIGVPDTSIYPFMGAVYGGPGGDAIEKSRVKLYGWIDTSWNVSSSTAYRGNLPAAYQINPNTVALQQAAMRLERIPDTVQKSHIDFGFRFSMLYGTDYKYTTMNGILSNQIRNVQLYGYDPNEFYAELYIPYVFAGMDIRIGRFISIPDIEADLSVDRPFSSLSYAYTYDPFSQMGIVTSTKLTRNWWVQLGLVGGDDVAIWAKGAEPTFVGCIRWESNDQRDSLYPCINSLNDGKYKTFTDGPTPASSPLAFPGNNLQAPVVTWGHRFTEHWTMQSEGWFMWMRDAPEYRGGVPTGRIIGFNYEWAVTNFQFWQFTSTDFLGWRNEMFDDHFGQRTGFTTRYVESTISWNHWLMSKAVGFRPEVRYDAALDNETPFNDGSRKNQVWAQLDLLLRL
jgi:hypothetical protein